MLGTTFIFGMSVLNGVFSPVDLDTVIPVDSQCFTENTLFCTATTEKQYEYTLGVFKKHGSRGYVS